MVVVVFVGGGGGFCIIFFYIFFWGGGGCTYIYILEYYIYIYCNPSIKRKKEKKILLEDI